MPRILSIVLVASLSAVLGCGPDKRLNAGGSTFVYPMMSKWADEYRKATGVEVNYQAIGSGGGIQQMTARTFDFGCTDGPMNPEQLGKCKEAGSEAVHIPLCMGAVVVTYNLEGVKEPLRFSGPVLARIFLGSAADKPITKWNHEDIAALNPGVSLPDKDILIVHRNEGSGTTYVFADFLAKVSPEWAKKMGVETSLNWRTGVGQQGNAGVAGQVRRSSGSIGYVELTYTLQNNMTSALIQNRHKAFVGADLASVSAAADASLTDIPDDLRYSITNAPGKSSYPISGTVWAVVYSDLSFLPAGKGQKVVDFLRWVTHDGQKYCQPLHYAQLPPGLVKRVEKKLGAIKTGG